MPLLFPRSDPAKRFFLLPNDLFLGELTAYEFAIMSYLFSRAARKLTAPNLLTVRVNLGVSRNTLKKYVLRLRKRDWIIVQHHRFSLSLSVRDTVHLTNTLALRVGHFFPMPSCVFGFGLSVGEIAVYGYLLYREDRETFECWPSYRTIGAALRMSKNTVRKYVHLLEEKEFIVTEPTQVWRKDGTKWNGNLKYHIRPIQTVVKRYNERYMREAQVEQERLRMKRLERYAARHPGFHLTVYGADEREAGERLGVVNDSQAGSQPPAMPTV